MTASSPRERCGLGQPGDEGIDPSAHHLGRVVILDGGDLPDDFGDGPIGDALAIRKAPSAENAGPIPDDVEKLGNEPALADPRRAKDREELARPAGDSPLKGLLECVELALSADHLGIETWPVPDRPRDPLQPVGDHGLRLALERDRLGWADLDSIADELVRLIPEHDLAWSRDLFKSRRDVDGIAGDACGRARCLAVDNFARVQPHPHLDADAEIAQQALVQDAQRGSHLCRPAHRSQRVVLVHERHSENRHDRIANGLLDGPPMPFEDRRHLRIAAVQWMARGLRIEGFAAQGRYRKVGDDRGYSAASLSLLSADSACLRHVTGRLI